MPWAKWPEGLGARKKRWRRSLRGSRWCASDSSVSAAYGPGIARRRDPRATPTDACIPTRDFFGHDEIGWLVLRFGEILVRHVALRPSNEWDPLKWLHHRLKF